MILLPCFEALAIDGKDGIDGIDGADGIGKIGGVVGISAHLGS
jgi:hypothetical protein